MKFEGDNVLKGFPLEAVIPSENGITLHLVAKTASGDIPKDSFTEPDGYKEMTSEEFEKEMGQMKF